MKDSSKAEKRVLTNEAGAPIENNEHSQRAGAAGPTLLQDHHLVEKLARFNRERIPERVVHAVGTGVYGTFETTHASVSQWTCAKLFAQAGKQTPVFLRFSTVAGSRGASDTVRDPRGFAVKFYTEEGNWDLVGNNTPVFFVRDGIKFPDFIHSQKPDPHTNRQEPDNVWDFFAHSPETTHQVVWLFGDRGLPASYRHIDGFGSHTFQWVNAEGARFWVKFHFKTDQGIKCFTAEEARAAAAEDTLHAHSDMYAAIERGDFPSWTLKVQVMPEAEAANYRFNPFDLTKVWPHADYPLIPIGKLTLNRLPENYFAEVEQVAFNPGSFVPGIGPSPDPMLQARLFGYGDAQRYRLGINHTRLPVNAPKSVSGGASNYGRDGAMAFDGNGGRSVNYTPNTVGGPAPTGAPYALGYDATGSVGQHGLIAHRDDDDFGQAGALYRVMDAAAKDRLIATLAQQLSGVRREAVRERALANFTQADADLGHRLTQALGAARG